MKLKLNPIHGTFDYVQGGDLLEQMVTEQLTNGAGQLLQAYDPFTATHTDIEEDFIVTDDDGDIVWDD